LETELLATNNEGTEMNTDTDTDTAKQGPVEIATRWGLVLLASIAAVGALLRMFMSDSSVAATRLDQTTLLYLAVAGVLLLLRQVKTFSMGQLKFELIQKLRERQDKQEERLEDIRLILPLLLHGGEVKHVKNLFERTTSGYTGSHPLRSELRRLRSIRLLKNMKDHTVSEMRDGKKIDLATYVFLTKLGRDWARRIVEMDRSDSAPKKTEAA